MDNSTVDEGVDSPVYQKGYQKGCERKDRMIRARFVHGYHSQWVENCFPRRESHDNELLKVG